MDWDIDYTNYNPVHELYIVDELIATIEQDNEDKNCFSINSKILELEDNLINCRTVQEARKTVELIYHDYMNN